MATSSELQHFAYSLHLAQTTPTVLLIDAIDQYFPDGSSSTVFQTMAYLLEARRYMARKGGNSFGEVVLSGESQSFMLSGGRSHALRRWCRFLSIERSEVSGALLPDQYTLREDYAIEDQGDEDDNASACITYSFAAGGVEGASGVFQLLSVTRSLPRA
ncbi:hypothetical protein P43SY_008690 [Pythium insidiosum]|uniref:Uncharacterized protein n=1 Tax=Pythium insidiosum TaxID=114742 RepID=A0AAD5M1Q0_PYTIN|nr:hypothetical protein P43SY_008690 [Pythium insidiosum]